MGTVCLAQSDIFGCACEALGDVGVELAQEGNHVEAYAVA